jgi:hypothetical protein
MVWIGRFYATDGTQGRGMISRQYNREMICLGSNAVGNLVDALVDSYLSTVYKLRELK